MNPRTLEYLKITIKAMKYLTQILEAVQEVEEKGINNNAIRKTKTRKR